MRIKGHNMSNIEFRDLKRQYRFMKESIDERISQVIDEAHFISGKEVKELEVELSNYVGRKHCITCANGTDAISIALMALGIGEFAGGSKNDAVFVPDFTFFSTGECPASVGAVPIFVDVDDDTYNISAESLEKMIQTVIEEGELIPKAVIAVDLFGQPYDYESIKSICDKYNLILVEDAAQGFGGSYTVSDGTVKMACSLGTISTTSFFPAKPLGCYGDGGAIFTDDDNLALLCRSIAVHGKDMEHPDDPNAKYNNIRVGMNSRLDTLQAAVLLAKLPAFRSTELDSVNNVARKYMKLLESSSKIKLPVVSDKCYSSWAQFTIQLVGDVDRSLVQSILKEKGIPTNIYYIRPMHKQGAFLNTRSSVTSCPNTERLCETVLCLPIHPYLEETEMTFISKELLEIL